MKNKFLFILKLLLLLSPLAIPTLAFANTVTITPTDNFVYYVPPYTGTMTITANGAGGGGGGGTLIMCYDSNCYIAGGYGGSTGSNSEVYSIGGPSFDMRGLGGTGGTGGVTSVYACSASGSGGSATGGSVSNVTGAGSAGGAGAVAHEAANGNPSPSTDRYDLPCWAGGTGGRGGQAVSTFTPATLPVGTELIAIAGYGGGGGRGGNDGHDSVWGNTGSNGSNGSIVITYTPGPDSPPSAPTITGSATPTTNVSTSYTFNSTSAFGYSLKYGIDWNNDGVIDTWSGTQASGSNYTSSYKWGANGPATIATVSVDAGGMVSATSTKTITVSPPAQQPLQCINGQKEIYSVNNTYPRTVPASFSTIKVEVWGAGGGGGGSFNGSAGGNTTFNGLMTGGGGGGGGGSTGGVPGTVGIGGTASGAAATTSPGINGHLGSGGHGGNGGRSPNGGSGGNGCNVFGGGFTTVPGGGGGGGCWSFNLNDDGGGGGGGAFASTTYTPATLTPGSVVSLVVGAGGAGGATGSGAGAGNNGTDGEIKVTCVPAQPTVDISSDAPLVSGVPTTYVGSTVHITANYAAASGDVLGPTAINGNDGVTSVPCANISPSNASCWTVSDPTKIYTFTPGAAGTYTFYAAAKTTNFTTYSNFASVTVKVVTVPTMAIYANGQQNSLSINSGQSATITWTASNVQSAGTVMYPTAPSWTVPPGWNSSNNTIEAIGGGGGGHVDATNAGAGGGGGGAYAMISSFSANTGDVVPITIGAAGTGDTPGGDTIFKNGSTLVAKGGSAATSASGGAGGSSLLSFGSIKYAGGNGGSGIGDGTNFSRGGGGGAAGPNGPGGNGGNGISATSGNGGGGGSSGGSNGSNGTATDGGAGGTSGSGGQGGAGGTININNGAAGTNGGGGGGGQHGACGGSGGNGTEWGANGSGGGAGGGCSPGGIPIGGNYGGGGAGTLSTSLGARGIIVVTNYTAGSGCTVTNSGDATSWNENNELVGKSTGALVTNRTYVLNCNDMSGNPATPVNVGISVVSSQTLPTLGAGNFWAASLRVRPGATTTVSWNVTGLSGGTTCDITPNISTGHASWDGVGSSWIGGPVATNPIAIPTRFTLTCTNGSSVSTSFVIGTVPFFKEQ